MAAAPLQAGFAPIQSHGGGDLNEVPKNIEDADCFIDINNLGISWVCHTGMGDS
jgi:hypothetical protein